MSTELKLMTAENLFLMAPTNDGTRHELVSGELVETAPAGDRHGSISFAIATILGSHLRGKDLGKGYTADTGFILRRDPDTVRAPDVAFVVKDRVAQGTRERFVPVAPDLAVEVVSPSDTAANVNAKVEEYLTAGTRLVWVVYPDSRSVMVYRSLREVEVFHEGDELDGRPVFEDFHVPVDELFG